VLRALQAAQGVRTEALPAALREGADGLAIGRAQRAARLKAITDALARP
jgi:hypothetical protein